MLYGNT